MNKLSSFLRVLLAATAIIGCSPDSATIDKTPAVSLNKFTISEVCKAGLATMYNRSASGMYSDHAEDGNIRISYKREQDGKQFRYRCKLDGNNILTYDESLNGAKWHGLQSDNSTLTYKVMGEHLRIHDIMGAKVNEKIFSKNELYPKPTKPVIVKVSTYEQLEQYAESLTLKHKTLKYRAINETTNNPLAYIIVFQTSSTDLLTKPDGDVNTQAYKWNASVTARWQAIFCTAEVQNIMRSENIGMTTGVIVDERGVRHSSAPCLISSQVNTTI
jgi:hypothetical protein